MTNHHIQMPAVTPIVRYTASGTQSVFSYSFPIFEDANMSVYLDGAKQVSGFTINGAGETSGGDVTFDNPPANGVIVTLARELSIERVTDFLEGGDFSAASINNELDYLVAALQQVNRENDLMLKYGDHEIPGASQLPDKAVRSNMVLGFDGNGDPVAVSTAGVMAAPDFTATGTGASTRTSSDKFSDLISVKDFGAVGDGISDDTSAIQNALAAHDAVFIPSGTYLITSTLLLAARKSLLGAGQKSVIKCQSNLFNAIELPEGYATLQNLRIEGGLIGAKLFGKDSACVNNSVADIQIIGANTGVQLDGYTDTAKPCSHNNFARILIEQPVLHGVHLTKSGAGNVPSANNFSAVRVSSEGASTTGSGFYVEHGKLNNSFVDCAANVNGTSADSCFRIGANSDKTLLVNLLTESTNLVPNVKLDAGSVETSILNLTSMSDGAAIDDSSSGNYDAYNAGYLEKNTMRKTIVSDLKATLMRFDTEFIDSAGTTVLDLSHSVHIVNATNGAITTELPLASTAAGAQIMIKKVDNTSNIVTVTENGAGLGPDGKELQLGGVNDYVSVISNGASWYIMASNRMSGNTRYFDGTGTYDIDMAVDTYLLSSFGGALTGRLPPANAAEAIGRTITIKKTDSSANAVTVTEQGGSGPDQSSQNLSSQYSAITVVVHGAQWYIVSQDL